MDIFQATLEVAERVVKMVTDVKSNPHISDVDLDSVEAVNELIIKLDEVFQISMPKFSLLWIQDIPHMFQLQSLLLSC